MERERGYVARIFALCRKTNCSEHRSPIQKPESTAPLLQNRLYSKCSRNGKTVETMKIILTLAGNLSETYATYAHRLLPLSKLRIYIG